MVSARGFWARRVASFQTRGRHSRRTRPGAKGTPPMTPTAVRTRRAIAVETVTPKKKKKPAAGPPAEFLALTAAAAATPAKIPSPAVEPVFLSHEETPEALPVILNSAKKRETINPPQPVGIRKSARLSTVGA